MAMCFQLIFLVCFTIGNSEVLDHRFFLGQIIDKYGYNGTIPYEGFERLYKNLGLGSPSLQRENCSTVEGNSTVTRNSTVTGNSTATPSSLFRTGREIGKPTISVECKSKVELAKLVDQHDEVPLVPVSTKLPHRRCLSPRELLVVYGLPEPTGMLSPVNFLHLCPAIIYELDQHTCVHQGVASEGRHHHVLMEGASRHSSWIFAALTILLISVTGLLSVALVPILHKSFVNQLISFLVALAIGTLLGDAFLHLIPHALESHDDKETNGHTDSVLKTGIMFLTVVFFFTFEAVLNAVRSRKEKHKLQENGSYVSVNQNKKEVLEMAEEHLHSHTHPTHNNIALMVIMGDGLHNLTDGLAIGAAFSGGLAPGFATAVAVFTHELPHELGDFAVLLQSGVTVHKALLYNVLSSVLSFLGTLAGLIIGNFGDATRWIYAITAGSFIYIALSNLVPEINRQKSNCGTIALRLCGILCGGALMGCIALFEHDIQHLFL